MLKLRIASTSRNNPIAIFSFLHNFVTKIEKNLEAFGEIKKNLIRFERQISSFKNNLNLLYITNEYWLNTGNAIDMIPVQLAKKYFKDNSAIMSDVNGNTK